MVSSGAPAYRILISHNRFSGKVEMTEFFLPLFPYCAKPLVKDGETFDRGEKDYDRTKSGYDSVAFA